MSAQTLLALPGLSPGLSSSGMRAWCRQAIPDLAAIDGVDLVDLVRRTSAAGRSGADGLAETLGEVLDERGVHRVIILAEGVGATAALRLAALRPELVAHLVLCAPFGYARALSGSWNSNAAVAQALRHLYLGDEPASQAALEVLCGGADLTSEGLSGEYRASAQLDRVEQAVTTLASWIEDGDLTPMKSPEGDRVRQSKVPVSLVWGRDDTVTGLDSAFYLNRRLKDVQLRIFSNVGHLVLETGGARVTRYIASVLAQASPEDAAATQCLSDAPAETVSSGA